MRTPTPPQIAALIDAARAASHHAYAPYSGFPVGAAVLTESGVIVSGCNVENASYPLGSCAERNAIVRAVVGGMKRLHAVAIFTPTGEPVTPCGSCRQVIREFADDLPIYIECNGGHRVVHTLTALLPHSFGPDDLK